MLFIMSDCIFCSIIGGGMGTEFLLEEEDYVVFRDINPKAKTHLLIVSKKHIPSVADMEQADRPIMGELIWAAKRVADDLSLKAYKLQVHVGSEAGQEIFHMHVHLLSNYA